MRALRDNRQGIGNHQFASRMSTIFCMQRIVQPRRLYSPFKDYYDSLMREEPNLIDRFFLRM